MVSKALLDPEHHVFEHQGRCIAQFVLPRDQRIAHIDFPLAQQPVGESRVVALRVGIDLDTGDVQTARGVAAHRELRAFDRQFPQPQIQCQDGCPCHQQIDFRQQQDGRRGGIGAIAYRQTGDRELGVPAIPACDNRIERHRLAELAGEFLRDRHPIVIDAGKDDEANHEQQRAEHEYRNQNRIAGEADAAGGERWGQGENLWRRSRRHNRRPESRL